MKRLFLFLALLMIVGCEPPNRVPPKYKHGQTVYFRSSGKSGIVMGRNYGLYKISYFNDLGERQVDDVQEVEIQGSDPNK